MLAVISPAKTLDFESQCPAHEPSKPDFLEDSEELISVMRKKSRPQIRELMGISEKLADLNYQRFHDWKRPFTEDNARAALLAFKGDVYTGFTIEQYGKRDFEFAQKHLRILSGLYGLLRPLDLIQPYRLEMGTRLKTGRGKDLYAFWDNKITHSLNEAIRESKSKVLVNLASNEYFSSVRFAELDAEVITPVFKDLKNDTYKIISFYAKKARGMMCDHMILNRIRKPDDLKSFDRAGYQFNESMSEGNTWVFTRDEPPSAAGS
ncbi:MAG: peroxide stress protein YaaA [Verrucomicrobiales bacterium]|nr:peroxide stress protein YaaA [Verrucomicrobiales bacterium]